MDTQSAHKIIGFNIGFGGLIVLGCVGIVLGLISVCVSTTQGFCWVVDTQTWGGEGEGKVPDETGRAREGRIPGCYTRKKIKIPTYHGTRRTTS